MHDDVLDAAELRRGRPTVVATAGRGIATATGDLLFSRAFAELAASGRADQVRVLSAASSALAHGELLQRADAFDAGVTRRRATWSAASTRPRGCSRPPASWAALEAGAPGERIAALGAFGSRIGLAFQLLDDVLDVSGPVERTGKARGTDLLDGTVTLPLILARERDPELGSLDVRAIATPDRAAAVCDRIEATGALARGQARERWALVAEAKRELPELPARQRRRPRARRRRRRRALRLKASRTRLRSPSGGWRPRAVRR